MLQKYSNIKFHVNLSIGSRVVPCEQTDGRTKGQRDRRTDMTTLTVAIRSFVDAFKSES